MATNIEKCNIELELLVKIMDGAAVVDLPRRLGEEIERIKQEIAGDPANPDNKS